jgi:fucose permease
MAFLLLRNAIDWRAGVILVVLCGAASVLNLTRVTVPDDRPAPGGKGRSGGFGFMKDPGFLVLAGMMLFYLCSEYAINGWLVSYIQHKDALLQNFGVTGEALDRAVRAYSQTMATLLWAVILVGRLTSAWLSQRIAPKKLMLIASALEAGCFAGLLFSSTIPAVTLCVAGLGFFMSGICPMIYADAAVYTNAYPMATGILLSFGSAGGIAMPTVVGALADSYGFSGGMLAILVAIALLVVFAALNVALGGRRRTA